MKRLDYYAFQNLSHLSNYEYIYRNILINVYYLLHISHKRANKNTASRNINAKNSNLNDFAKPQNVYKYT